VTCTKRELVLETSVCRRDIRSALGAKSIRDWSLMVSLRSTFLSAWEPTEKVKCKSSSMGAWEKHFDFHFR
jgi:hypothetical protein